MRLNLLPLALLTVLVLAAYGQASGGQATSLYLTGPVPDYAVLLHAPPSAATAAHRSDLLAVHEAEQARTAQDVAAAEQDDENETMFLYSTVLGPRFKSERLPITAALSAHLRHEIGLVDPPLKARFARPRPFQSDSTLHPVCPLKEEGSYPSGHAANGYLYGFALASILPERSEAILERADQYAQHRVTCGVHYPSDIAASRTVALALFGALNTSEAFRAELGRVREELRRNLH